MMNDDDNPRIKAAKRAALSGAVTGSLLGAGGALIGGKRRLADFIKAGLLGGGAGGALSGGSSLIGSSVLGAPDPSEEGAYARRGALGGAIGGGLVGATLGGLTGAGKMKLPAGAPIVLKNIAKKIGDSSMLDNVLVDKLKAYALAPDKSTAIKGALLGGGALGALAGVQGGDEGMGVDFINSEMDRKEKEKMRQAMMQRYMADGGY